MRSGSAISLRVGVKLASHNKRRSRSESYETRSSSKSRSVGRGLRYERDVSNPTGLCDLVSALEQPLDSPHPPRSMCRATGVEETCGEGGGAKPQRHQNDVQITQRKDASFCFMFFMASASCHMLGPARFGLSINKPKAHVGNLMHATTFACLVVAWCVSASLTTTSAARGEGTRKKIAGERTSASHLAPRAPHENTEVCRGLYTASAFFLLCGFSIAVLHAIWLVGLYEADGGPVDTWVMGMLFVIAGVLPTFSLSLLWTVAAEHYMPAEALSRYGLLSAGATVGALSGSAITFFAAGAISPRNLIVVSTTCLLSIFPVLRALPPVPDSRATRGKQGCLPGQSSRPSADVLALPSPISWDGGIRVVLSSM